MVFWTDLVACKIDNKYVVIKYQYRLNYLFRVQNLQIKLHLIVIFLCKFKLVMNSKYISNIKQKINFKTRVKQAQTFKTAP